MSEIAHETDSARHIARAQGMARAVGLVPATAGRGDVTVPKSEPWTTRLDRLFAASGSVPKAIVPSTDRDTAANTGQVSEPRASALRAASSEGIAADADEK